MKRIIPHGIWMLIIIGCWWHGTPLVPQVLAGRGPADGLSTLEDIRSEPVPLTLDLREPMALGARAIAARLDPDAGYRPWFMLRGRNGIPAEPRHDTWDIGDMTGRYLESLIQARRMGIRSPELSQAEWRLQTNLFQSLGADGLVHDLSGAIVHSFSQGSALFGLLAWYEDTGDAPVRKALERLITAQLGRTRKQGIQRIDPTVQLEKSSGSHLAGYQIFPVIRFHELTGYPDALELAEGLTRWALADPVWAEDGWITLPLSWEGHIHSWLETAAGCLRTARHWPEPERSRVLQRAKALYDWVMSTNGTAFGWIATFPTHGSCETCAIGSAIRLALELSAAGHPEYLDDVERFVRNQVIEAQFRGLSAYEEGTNRASPLLLGCFDSQSLPNGHLGTRGEDDPGTVEGCCLNGGMRALALAWDAIAVAGETGLTMQLGLSRDGPGGRVIGYQPLAGRIDVIPQAPGAVRVRLPRWVEPGTVTVLLGGQTVKTVIEDGFAVLPSVEAGQRVSVRFPLREFEEDITAGGAQYHVRWKGDVVMKVDPPGKREPCYQNRTEAGTPRPVLSSPGIPEVPDTFFLQDAARLAAQSMLARLDLARGGQPFFRIYPFADPPRAEHEKWDDGDMTGRYVEALIQTRRLTGLPMDSREALLRGYLARLFDPLDGLCYTQGTAWTPRRACQFSQSSAMWGLLAWFRETGSGEARRLVDRHVAGIMRLAEVRSDYALFPKYEWDGRHWVDEPKGKDAPPWYGGRLIAPLVEYWNLIRQIEGEPSAGSPRADEVQAFLEKLIRYVVEVSPFIKPDGAVERGEGWWGHLHGTTDMAAGIAEYGRLAGRPELVDWARRLYEWIGRTNTTRYGWTADVSGGSIHESCGIGSRIRLGLALYRAGVLDPFGEIDRFLRNQLLECQFVDLAFLPPLQPETPRTERTAYAGIDRMIRGTFQCWGTANDLIGHDDIEGCGAGGGVQALALAWEAMTEWRPLPVSDEENTELNPNILQGSEASELRIHLLFNRTIHSRPVPPFERTGPVAAELWSYLPYEGRAVLTAHRSIGRVALRLPDGADLATARIIRAFGVQSSTSSAVMEGSYVLVENVKTGERIDLRFSLKQYETTEHAAGNAYRVRWKGSAVTSLEPAGAKAPLYQDRSELLKDRAPLAAPRYP
ncbi:MAG: hypothetical protein ACE15F_23280 [bacterium]